MTNYFTGRVLPVAVMLLSSLLVVACATSTPSDRYRLQSVDTADDSKRFTYGYAVRSTEGAPARGDGGGRSSGGGQGQQQSRSANFVEMREELEIYMAATEYCTQGYFVYDETFDGRHYLLHGECQESEE